MDEFLKGQEKNLDLLILWTLRWEKDKQFIVESDNPINFTDNRKLSSLFYNRQKVKLSHDQSKVL